MKNTLLTTISILFLLVTAQSQELYINEFLASNQTGLTDAAGDFDDWVEIYNGGNSAVDMGGMYFTDDLASPTTWQIPTTNPAATTIPAGGYLVFFFDKETDQGILHVDAKLGASGEAIGLYASDGVTEIDSYTFGPQLEDVSEGRSPDGSEEWAFFTEPTPNATNDSPTGTGIAEIPVADINGGFYNGSVTVNLTSATPGATIYYTLDGSDPDDDEDEYTGAFELDETTVIRAIAYAPGLDPSPVMTHTYLIDSDHGFVVVTMTTDPDNLYNDEDGLFSNYEEELEKPAHVQFFEPDGTLAFSQNVEIELHGKGSLSLPQKSLKMKAKASLGNEFIEYPIFPQHDGIDKYRSFVVRQSGQDWNKTMFRDAMMQGLMEDISDLGGILQKPDLDLQSFRPGILYINGEYQGIQNVREQMNWRYIDTHYGIEKDNVDVVEDIDELKTGDLVEWEAFNDYLEDSNFSSDADYQELRGKADVDHFVDYMLHGIICDNNDWPGNNNRHWRERTPDGKWRWLSKDFDFGFGLRPINSNWNSGDFTTDMVGICLAEDSNEYYNRPPATLFLRRLMENEEARHYFINRAADFLNTVFTEDRVINRIDSLENLFSGEMQMHFDKWQSGWNGHAVNVQKLRTFANGRFSEVREHFEDNFDEVTGTSEVTLDAEPANGGAVQFSTITASESFFPWEGIYFRGIDVPAVATAERGYFFSHWSGAASGSDPEVLVDINSGSENLTAHFTLGSTDEFPIVINEINYNSPDAPDPKDWVELYNPNSFSVDISGWYFEDESGEYFGFPANTIMEAGAYFILAEDADVFSSIYPSVTNVYGSFGAGDNGFGLSGKGERITLKNAAGTLIDEVEYDDSLPWPEEPDGNGPTLQLIAPDLDNALPQSWISFEATPGEVNGGGLQLVCPQPIEVFVVPGSTGAVVNWTVEQPTSDCQVGTVNLVQTGGLSSGALFPVGTTTVTYQATDGCGNQVDCSFEVTVTVDAGTLTVDCILGFVINTATGASTAVVNWGTPTANSTCATGGLSVLQTAGPDNGSTLPAGVYTVVYSITDDCGNFEECGFDVTVVEVPSTINFICSDPFTVSSETGLGEVVTWDDPTTSTDCTLSNAVTAVQVGGPPNGSFFPLGTYTITYELSDACGAVETCSFTINVVDGTGTISLDCSNDLNFVLPLGESAMEVNWPLPVVSSTCGGGAQNPNCGTNIAGFTLLGTLDDHEYFVSNDKVNWEDARVICEDLGGYLATISDADENEYIVDNIDVKVFIGLNDADSEGTLQWANGEPYNYDAFNDPAINTVLNDYAYLKPWDAAWAMYADNIAKYYLMEMDCAGGGGLQLDQTSGPANGSVLSAGTYTITYEASDNCGDLRICSFVITVQENPQSLIIDCPADITVTEMLGAGGINVDFGTATATNANCAGAINIEQTGGSDSGSFFTVGSHVITYEATDACSNVEACAFTINVLPDVPSTEYCESEGSLPWNEHINNVTFGSINNVSGKNGYADFTDMSTTIVEGAAYTISILPKFSWTQYDEYIQVWIDYNHDFDFTDAGELVFATIRPAGEAGSVVAPVQGTIFVPDGVVPGSTRMRVSMQRDSYAMPCDLFLNGEVEDYTVNLAGGDPDGYVDNKGQTDYHRANESSEIRDAETNVEFDAAKSFKVYPNPASDWLTIDLRIYANENIQLEMYNALGQRMLNQTIDQEASKLLSVDVRNFSHGLFLITVIDASGKRSTQQVVVKD